MGYQINITGVCDCVVGDYTDVGEVPPGLVSSSGIKRQVEELYCYDEPAHCPLPPRPVFTVLLDNGSSVTVRGHVLKLLEPAHAGGSSHYAILERHGTAEVIVGLFGTAHVRGVFSGQLSAAPSGA